MSADPPPQHAVVHINAVYAVALAYSRNSLNSDVSMRPPRVRGSGRRHAIPRKHRIATQLAPEPGAAHVGGSIDNAEVVSPIGGRLSRIYLALVIAFAVAALGIMIDGISDMFWFINAAAGVGMLLGALVNVFNHLYGGRTRVIKVGTISANLAITVLSVFLVRDDVSTGSVGFLLFCILLTVTSALPASLRRAGQPAASV